MIREGRGREALLAVALIGAAVRVTSCVAVPTGTTAPPAADRDVRSVDDVPRVASYSLRAELDPLEHSVEGKGTLTFTNVSRRPLDALYVHLYLNAFENGKTRFLRKSASGFRGAGGPSRAGHIDVKSFRVREWDAEVWPKDATTDGDADDRTDIRVPLPQAIAPGATVHVDMEFHSVLPSIVLRTGFAGTFNMVAQWFPKVATIEPDGTFAHFPFERFSEFYADFGDYDVTVSVPSSYLVGATGERTATHLEGDRRVDTYAAGPVHDFAFAAWDGFEERSASEDGVAIRCLYPKGFSADAALEVETVKAALPRYGARYGAYPYKTLTIVHPPSDADEAGGMEYPTLITTGGPFWLAGTGTHAIELLTLHELGHQWFYGLVATNEHDAPFLDEGVTTYATGRIAQELFGDRPLTPLFPVSVPAGERVYGEGVAGHAAIAAHADQFDTGSDYGRLVYQRAATVMRTLDGAYDGVFGRALERYTREERFAHPSPERLIAAIRRLGGDEPARFAQAAFFERGEVRYLASIGPDGRGHVERTGSLHVPVDVLAIDEAGAEHLSHWDGQSTSYDVPDLGTPLDGLVVDPSARVPLDENLLQGRATRRHAFAPRASAMLLFLGEATADSVVP